MQDRRSNHKAIYKLPELSRHVLDSPNQMGILASSVHKTEGDHPKIKTVAALLVVMPTYYLYVEMYDLKKINLRCMPT